MLPELILLDEPTAGSRAQRLDRLAVVAVAGVPSVAAATQGLRSYVRYNPTSIAPSAALTCSFAIMATVCVCTARPEELEAMAVRGLAPWRVLALGLAVAPTGLSAVVVAVILKDPWYARAVLQGSAVVVAIVLVGSLIAGAGAGGAVAAGYLLAGYFGGAYAPWNLVLAQPSTITSGLAAAMFVVAVAAFVARGPVATRWGDDEQ